MKVNDAPIGAHPETGSNPTAPAPPSRPVRRGLGQPWLGLAGLPIILACWALIMVVPGPQRALEVVGAWSIFALPVLGVLALWWEGRPVTHWPRAAAGAVLTIVVIAVGAASCLLAQLVVGHLDAAHVFGSADEAALGHLVSFPFTAPLAACVFVVFLQLTFVARKWPFHTMPPLLAGIAAFATSWVLGSAVFFLLGSWDPTVPAPARAVLGLHEPIGPVNAFDLMAILLCVATWQMVVFLLLDGYPVTRIGSRAGYLVTANATTLVGGAVTWMVLHDLAGLDGRSIGEAAAAVITGTLVVGLLFERWPATRASTAAGRRWALLAGTVVVAVVTGLGLHTVGLLTETWTRQTVDLWVTVGALNFLSAGVIVHCALWRRWPMRARPAD